VAELSTLVFAVALSAESQVWPGTALTAKLTAKPMDIGGRVRTAEPNVCAILNTWRTSVDVYEHPVGRKPLLYPLSYEATRIQN
jgi:hypothetical protein